MSNLEEHSTITAIHIVMLRWWIYGVVPLSIGIAALSVLAFRFAKYERIPYTEDDQRLDRAWFGINILVTPGVAFLFCILWLFQDVGVEARDGDFLILCLLAAICSLVVTFFAVGIPLRLAMNLIIRARRSRYQLESIALVVTFAALAWMLYIWFTVPAEG